MSRASRAIVSAGALHPLAKKVPQVKKRGDPVENVALCQIREAQVTIIQTIMTETEFAVPLLGFLMCQKKRKAMNSAPEDSPFPDSYCTFLRLPTYWMSAHIVSVTCGAITLEDLEGFTKVNNLAVRAIFHYAHSTHDSDYWPRSMLVKSVLSTKFRLRYLQCGERLSKFKERFLKSDGSLDMVKMCPYTWEYSGEKVSKLTHNFTKAEGTLKEHQIIMHKNHSS